MRLVNRLSATRVSKLSAPGFYADGGGLYLQIGRSGGKSWIFRYQKNKKPHDMGLGGFLVVTLADARSRAAECRRLLSGGLDPLNERIQKTQASEAEIARSITFEECARQYIETRRHTWKSEKSAAHWEAALKTYVYPIFGRLPVKDVDANGVLSVLKPIWGDKFETASRLRGRIEAILDYAINNDHMTDDNPARWQGKIKFNLS